MKLKGILITGLTWTYQYHIYRLILMCDHTFEKLLMVDINAYISNCVDILIMMAKK